MHFNNEYKQLAVDIFQEAFDKEFRENVNATWRTCIGAGIEEIARFILSEDIKEIFEECQENQLQKAILGSSNIL